MEGLVIGVVVVSEIGDLNYGKGTSADIPDALCPLNSQTAVKARGAHHERTPRLVHFWLYKYFNR